MARCLKNEHLFQFVYPMSTTENRQSLTFLLNELPPQERDPTLSPLDENKDTSHIADVFAAASVLSCITPAKTEISTKPDTVSMTYSTGEEPAIAFSTTTPAFCRPLFARMQRSGVGKWRRSKSQVLPCDACGRMFREASALRKHKRAVHEKRKDFECDMCHRRFAEKSNLKKHVLSLHEDARPHKCIECDKMFHFTDGLRRHINNCHLGIRPFPCDLCELSFKQRSHMQKHRKNIHFK